MLQVSFLCKELIESNIKTHIFSLQELIWWSIRKNRLSACVLNSEISFYIYLVYFVVCWCTTALIKFSNNFSNKSNSIFNCYRFHFLSGALPNWAKRRSAQFWFLRRTIFLWCTRAEKTAPNSGLVRRLTSITIVDQVAR